jgi:hypothetical protein
MPERENVNCRVNIAVVSEKRYACPALFIALFFEGFLVKKSDQDK